LIDGVRKLTGINVEPGRRLATIKHGVTRFRITLDCYEARYVSNSGRTADPPLMKWLRPTELAEYPLSTTGRQLSRLAS